MSTVASLLLFLLGWAALMLLFGAISLSVLARLQGHPDPWVRLYKNWRNKES